MSNRSTPLNTPLRSAGHAIRAMQDLERQASANRRLAWERAGRPKPPPTPKKRYGHSGEVRACAARLQMKRAIQLACSVSCTGSGLRRFGGFFVFTALRSAARLVGWAVSAVLEGVLLVDGRGT